MASKQIGSSGVRVVKEEAKRSALAQISAHPLLITVVASVFSIASSLITLWAQGTFEAKKSNEAPLQEAAIEDLTQKNTALTKQLADAKSSDAGYDFSESITIPEGFSAEIIQKSFMVLPSIDKDMATLRLVDRDGGSEQYTLRTGGYVTLRPKGRTCTMKVGELNANGVTITNLCRALTSSDTGEALTNAQKEVERLQGALSIAQSAAEKAETAQNAAELRLRQALTTPPNLDAIIERITIPDGKFVAAVDRHLFIQVTDINNGVATATLKSTFASGDDEVFLTTATELVRAVGDITCRLTVDAITEQNVSLTTACMAPKQPPTQN